ncbi:MAG: adenylate/guanylate cyclase domain-containing protein, partial [Verrucomicrobiota bacterium]|nr:adenylate/guanylate cyclase domain-containing protein [Verrucomicrobiota bacterium]
MPESDDNLHLEIGHVLFIDIVGYSRLLIEEQKERLNQLTEIVLATAPVREAADEQLVRLPTGDGVALVFRNSSEEPAQCALEIAQALKAYPELQIRMGIHSGPVSEVTDVSGRTNIAGTGINVAQRVVDCGDAGHILLSKRVADDLSPYRQWSVRLHDLGECEVKHGARVGIVNLYTDEAGNPEVPAKLQGLRGKIAAAPSGGASFRRRVVITLAVTATITGAVGLWTYHLRPPAQKTASVAPAASAAPAQAIDKSIAVLPFENLSDDKSNAYFADGIQDQILTKLAGVADLKVISRISTAKYKSKPENLKTVAQELGVATVLEGTVQRAGDRVRVNVQLIDARADTHLWAKNYDRDLKDVFGVQSEVAQQIADALRAQLSPSEATALAVAPTRDPEAYDLFLQG